MNPFKKYNPIRPLAYWYNARRMNNYLGKLVDERFESSIKQRKTGVNKRSKSIIDLALDTYRDEDKREEVAKSRVIDPIFRRVAIDQIKLFMFAGHETTSSTASYMYHLLSRNSQVLHNVQEEHNQVLGLDISQAATILRESPHLLSQLHYSHAIIKEVLRLFPPVNSARMGEPGFFLEHEGVRYPTDGFMVIPCVVCCGLCRSLIEQQVLVAAHAIHRNSSHWDEPLKFIPERWLVNEGDSSAPVKGAWRPFEHGPRNCIGQEIAIIEIKIIMALTLRSFCIRSVYEEVASIPDVHDEPVEYQTNTHIVEGEMAYQILLGAAKPAKGMPVRVSKIQNNEIN